MLHRTVGELEVIMTAREMIEWGCFLALEQEQGQAAQEQSQHDKLLAQVLSFDAKLSGMQTLTREQAREL